MLIPVYRMKCSSFGAKWLAPDNRLQHTVCGPLLINIAFAAAFVLFAVLDYNPPERGRLVGY